MSHPGTRAVTTAVTVVLHIKLASGAIEVHELPAEGDRVAVPDGLLNSEEVLGFDVEIAGSDRRDAGGAPAASGSRRGERCGPREISRDLPGSPV
jgi:hypothetical protein